MNLMNATTSYSELSKKYNKFNAVTVEVTVGSTTYSSGKQINITEMDVELTSGYEASGCVFTIEGEYDSKKTDFIPEIDKFQIGEKVSVSLGYIKTEEVFTGYINRLDYGFGIGGTTYSVRVECMDAKGLLMKNRRMEFFKQKGASELVRYLLGEKPVSGYLSGMEIEKAGNETVVFRSVMKTDYDLIVEQAQKFGYEFFIIQGKAYFRDREKVSSVSMKLTPGQGILTARLTLSGLTLAKQVEVHSIDENNEKQISAASTINGKFSKGSSANRMMDGSIQVFYEAGVQDAKEAKQRAEARTKKMAEGFGQLEMTCIGIPELCPGRFVEVDRLSSVTDGKYYMDYVRHSVNVEGYTTIVKAGKKSL